ncbi:MAG: lipopolysaccharide biosynthesis protein [Acetobacteraceae bacterium]
MADNSVLKAQVLRGVAWASVTRIGGQMLNWVMTLAVVRFLAPADYGLMAITMAVTGFLAAMSYVGFSDVLVQSRDADANAAEALGLILIVNVVFLAILFAGAPGIASFYHDPRLTPLLRVVSLSFILLAVSALSRATLQRALALKQMSAIDMMANVLGGVATIVLAWLGFGVWALLDGYMLAETVRTGGFLILAPIRHFPALPTRRQAGLMRMGSYRTAENVLWYFSTQIDILVAGRLLGSNVLGIYSLARTLASLPIDKLATVVKPIGLPAFARVQDDIDQALSYLAKSMRVLALLSFPIFFGLSAVAHDLVPAVLGPRWAGAATPLAILALGMTLRPTGLFVAPFMLGLGHFRTSLVNTVIGTIMFGLAYVVGAHWGIYGICGAAAVAYPLQFLLWVHRVSVVRRGWFRRLLAPLLRPGLAAVLMYVAVQAVSWTLPAGFSASVRLGVLVATGSVVYAVCAFLLCRDIVEEVMSLLGLDRWGHRIGRPIGMAGP